ncbi:MAG TPA: ribosome maturation factor RimM [Terriglobales bacterium]|nr:ribosome maturation factor RimM [Terriglobales bacterium]
MSAPEHARAPAGGSGGPGSLVRIGRVGRAHGVHGEVHVYGVSLTPLEMHEVKRFLWRRAGAAERELTLATARPALARLLVRFEGIDQREQVAELVNGELWAERERLPDPGPTTAYTFQLVGLRVETEDGRALGVIDGVVTTAGNPVYVVRGEREILVPGAPGIVKRVDLAGGIMVVALPPGLEEL